MRTLRGGTPTAEDVPFKMRDLLELLQEYSARHPESLDTLVRLEIDESQPTLASVLSLEAHVGSDGEVCTFTCIKGASKAPKVPGS